MFFVAAVMSNAKKHLAKNHVLRHRVDNRLQDVGSRRTNKLIMLL